MINGIDLLFAVIGLILLFLFVEGWNRYSDWSEWDSDRRRERKQYRYEFQESFVEAEYRSYLRTQGAIVFATGRMDHISWNDH